MFASWFSESFFFLSASSARSFFFCAISVRATIVSASMRFSSCSRTSWLQRELSAVERGAVERGVRNCALLLLPSHSPSCSDPPSSSAVL